MKATVFATLAALLLLGPPALAVGAQTGISLNEWMRLAAGGALPTACATRDLPQAEPERFPPDLLDACPGIRPGARFSNVGCTMNFVYTDGASLYVGTAGHCTGSVGQRMSTAATGAFGSVVFRVNAGGSNDFSLIRVDADKVGLVNPQMCAFGGPTGAQPAGGSLGGVLLEYGWGVATQYSSVTRARELAELEGDPGDTVLWAGVGSGGDSGAPILDFQGNAIAIHTFGQTPVAGVVGEGGPHIQHILALVHAAGFNVGVVTAPF
jgi:hypothetical protein